MILSPFLVLADQPLLPALQLQRCSGLVKEGAMGHSGYTLNGRGAESPVPPTEQQLLAEKHSFSRPDVVQKMLLPEHFVPFWTRQGFELESGVLLRKRCCHHDSALACIVGDRRRPRPR